MAPSTKQQTLHNFFTKTPSRSSPVAAPAPTSDRTNGDRPPIIGLPSPVSDTSSRTTAKLKRPAPATEEPPAEEDEQVFGTRTRARKRVRYVESEDEDDVEKGDEETFVPDVLDEDFDDDADLELDMAVDSGDDSPPKGSRPRLAGKCARHDSSTTTAAVTPRTSVTVPSMTTEARDLSEYRAATLSRQDTDASVQTVDIPKLYRQSSSHQSTSALMTREEKLVENARSWLRPENIKDADGVRPGEPGYNPRTLYIPPKESANFSPFEGQFWHFKAYNFDSVIFFQKGKFYELYEDDAVLGHQLFDLKLTERGMRMVGVPDYSFEHWAAQFIAKGHRVVRVDQMESILGKELRDRAASGKKDKIVRRELTQILTQGTLVDQNMLSSDMSTYVMSIKETEAENGTPQIGAVFADAATGNFLISRFDDDDARTKLDTLLSQIRPREVVIEKGRLTAKTLKVVKVSCPPDTTFLPLKPESEYWDSERTLLELREAHYFAYPDMATWPAAVQRCTKDETALAALGGLVAYLRDLKLDKDLCSMGNFSWYEPLQRTSSLVLDGQSLVNLEIFGNTWDGGAEGTLFEFLNRCVTPFGKRLLRMWVCHPLQSVEEINQRLDAVTGLNDGQELKERIVRAICKLPDLERSMSRIHVGRCRVADFVKVLEGLSTIVDFVQTMRADEDINLPLVKSLIEAAPDMQERIIFWRRAFDWEAARAAASNRDQQGSAIVPRPGAEAEYDQSQARIDALVAEFDPLLKQYKEDLRCSKVFFRDLGASKEIYQIEVPANVNVPKDWQRMSSTKAVIRYWSPEVRALVRQLQEAQEMHKAVAEGVQTRFMAKFDEDYRQWSKLVSCIAQLDCLCSLADSSLALGDEACRPEILTPGKRTTLEFDSLRHPCNAGFIPNDVALGGDVAKMSLLTGPNMAGKSTLLRSVCVGVILAQLGHYVPATRCRLTPLDQVSVRTGGARDNIAAQRSTFIVELQETATILDSATDRSLVVLDELGRGTSTHDGVAIASAVLHHLATQIGCLGFFSTHYSALGHEFCGDASRYAEVRPQSMAYMLDGHRVTFLYKLEDGVCSHSHGLNVARIAGVPDQVIDVAARASDKFENRGGIAVANATSGEVDGTNASSTSRPMSVGQLGDFASLLNLLDAPSSAAGGDDWTADQLLRMVGVRA